MRKNGMKRLGYARRYGRAVSFYRRRRDGRFGRDLTFMIPESVVRTKLGTVVIGRNINGEPVSVSAKNINWQSIRMV